MFSRALSLALTSLALLGAASTQAAEYTIVDLGAGVTPAALAQDGRMGGSRPDGTALPRPAFLDPDTDVGPLPGLNPDGSIFGIVGDAATGRLGAHAFLLTPRTGLIDLDAADLPAFSAGNALNGTVTVGGLHNHGTVTTPILWFGGTGRHFLSTLAGTEGSSGAINALDEHGDAYGESDTATGMPHGTWWPVLGGTIDLDPEHPERFSTALAVSPKYIFLQVQTGAGFHVMRFARATGVLEDLGTLPGDQDALPSGANRHNVAVGTSFPPGVGEDPVAIRINADGSLEDLNTLLDAPEWTLEQGIRINDRGQIVGVGLLHGARHGFLLQPIPEGHHHGPHRHGPRHAHR